MPLLEPFVGRKKELAWLNDLLGKKTASLVVVKGRRRIGKSRLIKQFAKNKTFYSFVGLPPSEETTAQSERNEFARQLNRQTGMPEVFADDWSKLFILLANQVNKGRVILLFDEISWMGSKDSEFLPKLKNIWESHFKQNTQLILILCGSISSWIDENILSSTGYFGRINWRLDLKPLPLHDCNSMLEEMGFKYSAYEKFKILSVTGGVPWYLEQIQGQFNADENIKRQCFTDGAVLVEDFDQIFHDYFDKKSELYKKIIMALVKTPLSSEKISKKVGYPSSGRFSEYLSDLVSAGFIRRNYTLSFRTKEQSDLSVYRISDNYLRFYLKYIGPNRDKISRGQYEEMTVSSLPAWESAMGYQFENLVLENRKLLWKLLHIKMEDILYDNPYFQYKTTTQEACQIDYLIQTKFNTYYVFEIKFSRNPVRSKVVSDVNKKIEKLKLPRNAACLPVLVHVNGVDESLLEKNFFFRTIDFSSLLIAE